MTTADWTPPDDFLDRASAGLGSLRLRRVGELAVEQGLISEDQLQEALRLHAERPPDGPAERLLADHGWIPPARLDELVEEMGRRIPTLFEVHGTTPGGPVHPVPPAGDAMSRYELLEKIGEGGMGIVHRARDRQLDRIVALKILKESAAASPVARNRFQQEAQATARLSHPNIVSVYDVGEDGDRMFFVMELVEGQPLHHLMNDRTTDLRLLVRLIERIARGLHHAHENDIVHRDVKPANILVTRAGEPKIVDFGVAHIMGSGTGLTKTGSTVGTPFYMAPEQVHGRVAEITGRTDIYALGVMLYEATARRPPFNGESVAELYSRIVNDEPVPPRRISPAVPVDLETIAMKALDKEPSARYATAKDFADDLARWLEGEPILARPLSLAARLGRKAVKHRAILLPTAVAAVLAAVLAGGWVAGQRDRREREAVDRLVDGAREPIAQASAYLYSASAPWAQLTRRAGEAQKLLLEAVGRDPGRVQALHLLGRTWSILGRDDMAEREWRRAIALDPKFSQARFDLARLLEVRSLYETLGVSDAEVRRRKPESQRLAHEALEECRAAIALQGPGGGSLEREIAETLILFVTGNTAEVRRRVDAAVLKFGDQPGLEDLCLLMALAVPDQRDLAWLDRAIRIRPKFPAALLFRGLARKDLGDARGAEADLGASLEIDPNRYIAWVARGTSRLSTGDYEGAVADNTRAIQVDPSQSAAWANRAIAFNAMRRSREAADDATKAIERDPARCSIWVSRGIARGAMGDREGAMADYDRAIELDPGHAEARLSRAQLRSLLENYKGADEDATVALAGDATLPEALITRGLARNNLGRPQEALLDLKRALDLIPVSNPRRERVELYIQRIESGGKDKPDSY